MRDNLHIQPARLGRIARPGFGSLNPRVHQVSYIALQTAAKVLVECRAAGEDDVLVQPAADIDGRGLDNGVDDIGQRGEEVGGPDFGVEEDLGGEEALVSDVHAGRLAVGVFDFVFLEAVLGLAVEARELFHDVWADVAEFFLDALRRFQAAVGFPAVPQQALHEVRDVAARDGDAFDAAADYVALRHGDDVGDAFAAVDYGARQAAVLHFAAGPAGGEGEDGLYCDVEAGAVEGLEHDFRGVFAVFGWVERGFGEQEVVVFGLYSQVFEDAVGPEAFHVVLRSH